MRVIKPGFEIIDHINRDAVMRKLEGCARTCYQSRDKAKEGSADRLIRACIKSGHESVIEHVSVTIRIICDRGISHEIVRHRLAAYSQESTRYCNYGDSEVTFIKPCFFEEGTPIYEVWEDAMEAAEQNYNDLLEMGARPEEARSVLPNSLKTELVMTMNLRELRHFFKMRCAKDAHPQIREIARPMLSEFKRLLPAVFGDLIIEE